MRTDGAGGGVIGQDGDGDPLVPFHCLLVNCFDDPCIEIFDCFYFQCHITLMARLVTRLHMKVNEVPVFQCLEGSRCFSLVIGVIESRGTLHHDHLKPCIDPDAADQVHCRDHRTAADGVEFAQGSHLRAVAGRPGPDAVGRMLSLGDSFSVHRMIA